MRYLLLAVGLLLSVPAFAQVQPGGSRMATNASNSTSSALAALLSSAGSASQIYAGPWVFSGTLDSGVITSTASSAVINIQDTRSVAAGIGGAVALQGKNANSAQVSYAGIHASAVGAAAGVEAGNLALQSMGSGTLTDHVFVTNLGLLTIGGTSSSFSGLKDGGATLKVRLADDTADASINAANGTFTGTGGVTLNGGPLVLGTTSSAPIHARTGQTTAPALTSCGGGSPAITGTDTAGIVTMGSTATGCVITFNVAYAAAPYCVVSWIATPLASQSYATSNTAITLTQTSTSGNKVQYICIGQAGG